MDLNRLITMVTQTLIRTAVDKGIEFAARRRKGDGEPTPAEQKQSEAAMQLSEKAKDLAKVGRKLL